jgi:hypothetical protein
MKMGGTGLEQTALTPTKTLISKDAGTKSGTVDDKILEKFPELQKVITSWPLLPEQVKKQILSLIEANIQKETKTIENNSKF